MAWSGKRRTPADFIEGSRFEPRLAQVAPVSDQRHDAGMKRIAGACIFLVLLAGCSSAPAATPKTTPTVAGAALDAIFLDAVKTDAPALDDATLLGMGHIVCKEYAADPSVNTWLVLVKSLADNGFTGTQAGRMTGAATAAYCPQYSDIAPKP
jgi:hypothetical protein